MTESTNVILSRRLFSQAPVWRLRHCPKMVMPRQRNRRKSLRGRANRGIRKLGRLEVSSVGIGPHTQGFKANPGLELANAFSVCESKTGGLTLGLRTIWLSRLIFLC